MENQIVRYWATERERGGMDALVLFKGTTLGYSAEKRENSS